MEERTRVTNGMIKDIVGVDCDGCQHKDVCRFCESAETFIRDIKGAYPTGGSAPFVLTVSCTHNSKLTFTRSGDWSMGVVRDITNPTMSKDANNGSGDSSSTTSNVVTPDTYDKDALKHHMGRGRYVSDDVAVPIDTSRYSSETDESKITTRELK